MPAPFVTNGKQVLHTVDGLLAPYADAVSVLAADNIAAALNTYETEPLPIFNMWKDDGSPVRMCREGEWEITETSAKISPKFIRGITHHIERQGDEYACSCGTRWDVADGEEHP